MIPPNLAVFLANFTAFLEQILSFWQPHILVVDDDRRLRELLSRTLAENGYLVATASDAQDAKAKLEAVQFDALVLDVMMPGQDGMALTRELRARPATAALPVLLLTARGEKDDRIAGLEAGSDDYLVKPFEPRELHLRLQAILRRVPREKPDRDIWFGRLHYNMARDELQDEGEVLRLSQVEAGLLRLLAENPGRVISREQLVERSPVPINDRTVDVQVTRLRRKIEPDAARPRFLVTVRGEGYMLLPEKDKTLP